MKRLFIITAAVSALTLTGCNSSTDENGLVQEINIEDAVFNETTINLSEIASAIEYIPLETTTDAYLGNVNKCTIDNNYIYIASTQGQKTIHVFSKDGKFLRNIGSKGRAKGEYIAIRKLSPLTEKRAVTVTGVGKTITYSAENGSVISETSFDELLQQADTSFNADQMDLFLEHGSNGSYCLRVVDNRDLSQRIVLFDSKENCTGEIELEDAITRKVKTSLPTNLSEVPVTLTIPWVYNSMLYNFEEQTNVISFPVDTIFCIKDNKLEPRYTLNYGKFKKDGEIINNDILWMTNLTELSNIILLHCSIPDKKGGSSILYNKKSGKSYLLKKIENMKGPSFVNDLDSGAPFWPAQSYGNKMYMFLDAGKFIDQSEEFNSPRMKEIAATLTEESNPVMIVVTLKK